MGITEVTVDADEWEQNIVPQLQPGASVKDGVKVQKTYIDPKTEKDNWNKWTERLKEASQMDAKDIRDYILEVTSVDGGMKGGDIDERRVYN